MECADGTPGERVLAGAQILIVESNAHQAHLLQHAVTEAGGVVVGPTSDFESASALIAGQPISGALIALYANGARCSEVAAELSRRAIPFAVTFGLMLGSAGETGAQQMQVRHLLELLATLLQLGG
jgi:hypothetical protein